MPYKFGNNKPPLHRLLFYNTGLAKNYSDAKSLIFLGWNLTSGLLQKLGAKRAQAFASFFYYLLDDLA
jgi:hypothetical protein